MAVIAFSPDQAWLKARWVFRRFLRDVSAAQAEDPRLAQEIRQALALDGMHLNLIGEELRPPLLRALRSVAEATLKGSSVTPLQWRAGLDEESQSQYLAAISELLPLIATALAGAQPV